MKMRFCLFFLCSLFSICTLGNNTPKRIVSLAPSLTKYMYELGAQSKLVGCTNYCTVDVNDSIELVASAVKVNVEKVLVLKPDLILVSSLTEGKTIQLFKQLGIEVLYLDFPKSFNEICSQLIFLGSKLGYQSEAHAVVDNEKARLESILEKLNYQSTKPSIFMQIGANPLFTVVPNTYMDDFISMVGAVNIASDLKSGSMAKETVIARNPDYIFVVIMGIGEEQKKEWSKYTSLTASSKQQIFTLDADKACSPTPKDFVDVLEEIIKKISSCE